MVLKNLENALDRIFGPFGKEKDFIIEAAIKDIESMNKVDLKGDCSEILTSFNEIFNKRSRIISKKICRRYKEILKFYSVDEIKKAMSNAKNDDFHKDNSYKYCTLEYFSRLEQIDKWSSSIEKKEEKNKFIMPKFNTK